MAIFDHARARERRKDGCVHPYEPDEPSGYVQWHEWAEKKAKTHDQGQCPECGLWVVYTPTLASEPTRDEERAG